MILKARSEFRNDLMQYILLRCESNVNKRKLIKQLAQYVQCTSLLVTRILLPIDSSHNVKYFLLADCYITAIISTLVNRHEDRKSKAYQRYEETKHDQSRFITYISLDDGKSKHRSTYCHHGNRYQDESRAEPSSAKRRLRIRETTCLMPKEIDCTNTYKANCRVH